jgi:hypothetical protein
MEGVWNTPEKKNTARGIFRGQTDPFPLIPKLFRAHEFMSVQDIEALHRGIRQLAILLIPTCEIHRNQYR